ncbi:hypothetical protein N7454_010135 [Penicillium verhagenii]|nr:hypothetical protein N7454_010135 [Penicillium verhagenii]
MRVLIITTLFTILSTLFVSVRLWTRIKLVRSPGKDDILIFAALISSLAFYGFLLAERHYGLGVPKPQLSDDVVMHQLHYLWLSVPFYNLTLILSKLSALFLFIRIFRARAFLLATYITMGFLIIAGTWMVVSGFVFCIPIHDFWRPSSAVAKHCLPRGPIWYSNAAMQILSDVVILVLPMPALYKLQLPPHQKIGIMVVFGVGIFVIATSSARLYELSTMLNGRDFTKTNAEAAVWSSLEANVSIICACMPPSTPFISNVFSYCFRPQPLHSTPWPKTHSNATCLTDSRMPSIYDHGHGHAGDGGGVFSNDFFYAGPGGYSASISKIGENDEKDRKSAENEDGIRVVRELRMVSDSVMPSPRLLASDYAERDVEMGEVCGSGSGSGTGNADANGGERGTWNPSIEWDLGDYEFPDYKERMNAPI